MFFLGQVFGVCMLLSIVLVLFVMVCGLLIGVECVSRIGRRF